VVLTSRKPHTQTKYSSMATQSKLRVAIIGAGVAGLATAVGLQEHPDMDVQIYEKAKQLEEIGASIALGPNGMRTLERLGVDNALDDSVAFRNPSGYPMIYRYDSRAPLSQLYLF
jgi:salicylate hydroxylase